MGHPVKLGILHLSARIRPIPKLQNKDLGRQTKCSPVTDKVLLVIESSNRAESGEAGAIVAMGAVVVHLNISYLLNDKFSWKIVISTMSNS